MGELARSQLGQKIIWIQAEESRQQSAASGLLGLQQNPGDAAVEFPMYFAGLYARADALLAHPCGGYVLQETKSNKFPLKPDEATPGKPEQHLLDDVAIQYWLLENSGIALTRAELNLIDGRFIYQGDGDYKGLFRTMDVTADVETLKHEVPVWLAEAQKVVSSSNLPSVMTGPHCGKPHECAFKQYCIATQEKAERALRPAGMPYASLTTLPDRCGKLLAAKLSEMGFTNLVDVPPSKLTGSSPNKTALYRRIRMAHATGQAIIEAGVAQVIDGLSYPRYFFDFEGIDLVIPVWKGMHSMEQVTFQWSCHIQRTPGGEFEHHEFLDLSGDDPTLSCLESMAKIMPDDAKGSILVFYATYERCRMLEMAARHPSRERRVKGWIARMVDLHPIVKENYYHPIMAGSFSIKKVLKAMAPELDYENLDGVKNGTDAQLAYLDAARNPGITPARKSKVETNMLRYCSQDTWANSLVAKELSESAFIP